MKHNLLIKIGLVENSEQADKIIDGFLKDNKEVRSYQRDLITKEGLVMCFKFETLNVLQDFINKVLNKNHILSQVLLPNFRFYYPPSLILTVKYMNSKRGEEGQVPQSQKTSPSVPDIYFDSIADLEKNRPVFDALELSKQNYVLWYIFSKTLKKYAADVKDILVETDLPKMQKVASILFNRQILEFKTLEEGLGSLESFRELLNQIISF